MERKKDWKDFGTLVRGRPDYRRWLYCEDQEEKALWMELLDWEKRISHYASQIRRTPVPAEPDDVLFARSSLHIDRRIAVNSFLELLFESCLRKQDDETLNLLFSFLEACSGLLEQETRWCQT